MIQCGFLLIIFQEFQSFTDLEFSKERTITCIDWHPTIKGVVAVSVGERLPFDDRVDNAHRIIMTPSLILVWSFSDPIHPQVCHQLTATDQTDFYTFARVVLSCVVFCYLLIFTHLSGFNVCIQ